jgi:hypothetical protein
VDEVLFSHEDGPVSIVVSSVDQQIMLCVRNIETGRVINQELPAIAVEPIVLQAVCEVI